jgi:hypothetical protein
MTRAGRGDIYAAARSRRTKRHTLERGTGDDRPLVRTVGCPDGAGVDVDRSCNGSVISRLGADRIGVPLHWRTAANRSSVSPSASHNSDPGTKA